MAIIAAIMDMLDWNYPAEAQAEGRALQRISIFRNTARMYAGAE